MGDEKEELLPILRPTEPLFVSLDVPQEVLYHCFLDYKIDISTFRPLFSSQTQFFPSEVSETR